LTRVASACTSSSGLAKAKVAGLNPVFRSKLAGFRLVSGSGLFHGRRVSRRRRWFTVMCRCGHEPHRPARLRTRRVGALRPLLLLESLQSAQQERSWKHSDSVMWH
jgi:hypothetical protein